MSDTVVSAPPVDQGRDPSPAREAARLFLASPLAAASLIVVLLMLGAALAAPFVTPQNPYDLTQLDVLSSMLPPGAVEGDKLYLLGTDDQGRDLLSAIIFGLRTSLLVAVTSALCAMVLGTAVGLVAAFFGGRTDVVLMRLVDIQLSFPTVLIALVLVALLGRGIDKTILALVAVQWAYYARTVRGAALAEKKKEYIEAATALGLGRGVIMLQHLLPNCLPPLIVVATVQLGHAVALEATLSFLGLGVPVTEPSLGLLIANGFEYMLSGKYWLSFFPGMALLLLIVTVNLLSDRLREILDPRSRR